MHTGLLNVTIVRTMILKVIKLHMQKTHATVLKKEFIPLYLKHLEFLVKRAGWLVTKFYPHYTFEQGRFKKDYK